MIKLIWELHRTPKRWRGVPVVIVEEGTVLYFEGAAPRSVIYEVAP